MTSELSARMRVIALASALALLAGPALAQSTTPGAGPAPSTGLAPSAAPGAAVAKPRPIPNPLTQEDVSNIKGTAVYDSQGKDVGSVSTVLMKPQSKTIDRLVVTEGAILGIGGHYVALPVSDFSWDKQKEAFKVAKTIEEIKAMPAWHEREQVSEAATGGAAATTGANSGTAGTAPQKAPAQ